jgi:predicted transcriptional regulator
MAATNLGLIEPDLAKVFPDGESVNRALRILADAAAAAKRKRRTVNERHWRMIRAFVQSGGYTRSMEVDLTPETQARLNELALRTRRGTDELLAEAVDHLVAYNEWLERKVGDSMAAVARGETVPDEEVRVWLGKREHC